MPGSMPCSCARRRTAKSSLAVAIGLEAVSEVHFLPGGLFIWSFLCTLRPWEAPWMIGRHFCEHWKMSSCRGRSYCSSASGFCWSASRVFSSGSSLTVPNVSHVFSLCKDFTVCLVSLSPALGRTCCGARERSYARRLRRWGRQSSLEPPEEPSAPVQPQRRGSEARQGKAGDVQQTRQMRSRGLLLQSEWNSTAALQVVAKWIMGHLHST